MPKSKDDTGPKPLCLRVKTLDSNTHNVKVIASESVTELKRKVCDETGIEVERQRLIFQGKVLKDDKNVDSYSIRNGMTIHMVEKVALPFSRSEQGSISTNGSESSRPQMLEGNAVMFSGEGLSLLSGSSPRHVARLVRPGPSSLQISETPEGIVVGASIDLNDGGVPVPPMENLFSGMFGLIRPGNSPRRERNSSRSRPRSRSSSNRSRSRRSGSPSRRSRTSQGSASGGTSEGVQSFGVAGFPFARISSMVGGPQSGPTASSENSSNSRDHRSGPGFSRRRRVIDMSNSLRTREQRSSLRAASSSSNGVDAQDTSRESLDEGTVRLRQNIRDARAQLDDFVNQQDSSSFNSSSSSRSQTQGEANSLDELADSLLSVGDAIREVWPVLQQMGFVLKNRQLRAQSGTDSERQEISRDIRQRLVEPCASLSGALQTMSVLTSGLSQDLRRIDGAGSSRARRQPSSTSSRDGNSSSGIGSSSQTFARVPGPRVDEVPTSLFHLMRQLMGASRIERSSTGASSSGRRSPATVARASGTTSSSAGSSSTATRSKGSKRKREDKNEGAKAQRSNSKEDSPGRTVSKGGKSK